jgi:hypothetical protein
MREPQCNWLLTLGAWRKMVRTSVSLSPTSRPRATAVLLLDWPSGAGSAKVQKTSRLVANSGSTTTSSSPHCPPVAIGGRPVSGSPRVPSAATMRSRPARSVTTIRPSGRKARPQGLTRPRAMVTACRLFAWARLASSARETTARIFMPSDAAANRVSSIQAGPAPAVLAAPAGGGSAATAADGGAEHANTCQHQRPCAGLGHDGGEVDGVEGEAG